MHSNDSRYQILLKLQKEPENIRNISIIAHVDHGKTTLSDALISSNNIISKKLIGKLLYLDSRPDEHERQITMKSSSISLIFTDQHKQKEFLINLIDSPGHVGFYSEVSSALRLTDGALILVDVLEGVSTQTYTVLKQAFQEKVTCILVLNKIDRLIYELEMSPSEAYHQFCVIIEQVNAILSSFIVDDLQKPENITKNMENGISLEEDTLDMIESKLYFAPEKGNVVFCSALHNWAFTLEDFAGIFAAKLKCNSKTLEKFLWGDFYMNPKNKKVFNKPVNEKSKPIFVEFVLQNVWNVYAKVKEQDAKKVEMIAKSLSIDLPNNYSDLLMKQPRQILVHLMNGWLPFDKNLPKVISKMIPSPAEAQKQRLAAVCKKMSKANNADEEIQRLKSAIEEFRISHNDPTIVYISKMMAIPKENINERGLNPYDNPNKIKFIGFARVFSGILRRHQKIFIITPNKASKQGKEPPTIQEATISNLYVIMGQYLGGVSEACAGNIVGIGNLDELVFKTATLSSSPLCPSFTPILTSLPHLKVSLRTENIEDFPRLIDGLKKLNKSDPSVEVSAQENGDIVLATCGEVHLERCIRDLEDTLAKVKVKMSEPLVGFRETVVYENLVKINNPPKKDKEEEWKEEREEDREEEDRGKKYGEEVEIIKIDEEKPEKEEMRFYEDNYRKKQEQKEAFLKQVSAMPKKIDNKNKAKYLMKNNKMNLIRLNLRSNVCETTTANKKYAIKVRTIGIKFALAEYLERQSRLMRKLFYDMEHKAHLKPERAKFFNELKEKMLEIGMEEKTISFIKSSLVSFGPKRHGPNLLLIQGLDPKESIFYSSKNEEPEESPENTSNKEDEVLEETNTTNELDEELKTNNVLSEKTKKSGSSKPSKPSINKKSEVLEKFHLSQFNYKQFTPLELQKSLIAGFEMSVSSGPLCDEPMMGVCFIVESFREVEEEKEEENKDLYGSLSGQIMSSMKEACIESFLGAMPRLVEGVYLCELLTDSTFYGKCYEVLNKRRARILEDTLNENSNIFHIRAHLPVQESFGFYGELLDKTAGRVNAGLSFETWQVFEVDPFFSSQTEQELEEFGDQGALLPNIARDLIHKIRNRKGILTDEKLVVNAEKQRTLSKKK